MSRLYIIVFAIAAALAVIVPIWLQRAGLGADSIAAWGTWAGVIAVLIVGAFAIPQLALNKASAETDVFLKASCIIDDEEKFGQNYGMVTEEANASLLQKAAMSDNGVLIGIPEGEGPEDLANAALDVLYALEQVGIIFHYATNKAMIEEYVGDVVIKAHDALSAIIKSAQKDDPHMFERFQQMYEYCAPRWTPSAVAKSGYTNLPT